MWPYRIRYLIPVPRTVSAMGRSCSINICYMGGCIWKCFANYKSTVQMFLLDFSRMTQVAVSASGPGAYCVRCISRPRLVLTRVDGEPSSRPQHLLGFCDPVSLGGSHLLPGGCTKGTLVCNCNGGRANVGPQRAGLRNSLTPFHMPRMT